MHDHRQSDLGGELELRDKRRTLEGCRRAVAVVIDPDFADRNDLRSTGEAAQFREIVRGFAGLVRVDPNRREDRRMHLREADALATGDDVGTNGEDAIYPSACRVL